MELTERKKQVLKIVVEEYVRTAEPVGSRTIAAKMGGVSSATIRSELNALTELGYLEQPHTSAGRAPTHRGYRLYVDSLMEHQRLSLRETEAINAALRTRLEEMDRIIAQAGRAASAFLNYPTYAAAAGKKKLSVRRFDLIGVDPGQCIAVLMLSSSRVKSQLLRLQLPVEPEQLPALANLLNAHFTGLAGDSIEERVMDLTGQLPPNVFLLLSQIAAYAGDVLEEQQRSIVTAGARELLKLPEFRDAGKAHALMSFLSDGKEALPVPEEDAPVKILIGPENVSNALRDASVVVASYDIGDEMRGLIGVVGPTRMDYAQVAARLTGFAEGMARLFGAKPLPPKEESQS